MLSHSKDGNDSIIVNHNTSIGIKQPFISNEPPNYLFNEFNITQEDNESDINLNDNLETSLCDSYGKLLLYTTVHKDQNCADSKEKSMTSKSGAAAYF